MEEQVETKDRDKTVSIRGSEQSPTRELSALRANSNRKKSATYYEKHKAEVLAKRKVRYEAEKERLQTIQREYARKKRAEAQQKKIE
jgi:hypothetical protein